MIQLLITRGGIAYKCTECDEVFTDDAEVEAGHDCEA